ncbi:MAG: lysophospholipid acyltransferase family protein [Planctomycetota bacterium]|jgi:1-acyl-sn-glycerol-3-phosphate acyltransferase
MNDSASKSSSQESWAWEYFRKLFYRFLRLLARMLITLVFELRVEGRQHLRAEGGAMLLSTHQSVMDPVLVGLLDNHFVSYLARHTLFHSRLFAFLIRVLNAIEIDRERGGLSGLREMLRRLKAGDRVLLFPEGTRTTDGEIGPLKPGFIPIARRSKVPLIPIALAGAYDCVPKGSKLFRFYPISVCVGPPLQAAAYDTLTDEQLLAELTSRLHALHTRALQLRSRS